MIPLALPAMPWHFRQCHGKKGGKEQKKLWVDRLLPPKVLKRCGRGMALMSHFPSPAPSSNTGGSWLGGSALELGIAVGGSWESGESGETGGRWCGEGNVGNPKLLLWDASVGVESLGNMSGERWNVTSIELLLSWRQRWPRRFQSEQ